MLSLFRGEIIHFSQCVGFIGNADTWGGGSMFCVMHMFFFVMMNGDKSPISGPAVITLIGTVAEQRCNLNQHLITSNNACVADRQL